MNIYFPNDGIETRLPFKMKFCRAVQLRAEALIKSGRHVILVGDINATWHPADHCDYLNEYFMYEKLRNSEDNSQTHVINALKVRLEKFYDHPPRQWLRALVTGENSLFVDLYRHFNLISKDLEGAKVGNFTCWNTKLESRKSNYGSRIDHIFANRKFLEEYGDWLLNCVSRNEIAGSDHCPVELVLSDYALKGSDVTEGNELFKTKAESLMSYLSQFNFITKKKSQKKIVEYFKKKESNYDDSDISPEKKQPSEDISECKEIKKRRIDDYFSKRNDDTISPDQVAFDDVQIQTDSFDASASSTSLNEKESVGRWQQLFTSKRPLCKSHQEPCKMLRVNKKGVNRGRYFYVCNRGPGHSSDPNAKCDYFEWATS